MNLSPDALRTIFTGGALIVSVFALSRAWFGESLSKSAERAKLTARVSDVEQRLSRMGERLNHIDAVITTIPTIQAQLVSLDRLMEARLGDVARTLEHTSGQLDRLVEARVVASMTPTVIERAH